MSSCARNMWCIGCGRPHDLQDTAKMLRIAKVPSPYMTEKLSPAIAAAQELVRSYSRATSADDRESRSRADEALDRSMPLHLDYPAGIADLFQWALGEFGPRNVDDRRSLAQSMRDVGRKVQECEALFRSGDVMTKDELNHCIKTGRGCCDVHDKAVMLCSDLYSLCDTMYMPVRDGLGRLRSNSSSWIVSVAPRAPIITEILIANIGSWAECMLLQIESGIHVSVARSIVDTESRIGGLPPVDLDAIESFISLQLGPSDWE